MDRTFALVPVEHLAISMRSGSPRARSTRQSNLPLMAMQ